VGSGREVATRAASALCDARATPDKHALHRADMLTSQSFLESRGLTSDSSSKLQARDSDTVTITVIQSGCGGADPAWWR
jgi:hypothetical protein